MFAALMLAATLRVFGSTGLETQLTPANVASPLNPRNVAAIPYRTNSADGVAFVEASTDDKRWKVRAKLRGEASDRAADRGTVAEALVQFAATDWLDVTAGRVIEKWGTGYGWTPTAFIGPAKNPTDPSDRRSSYSGRDMVRADAFVRDTSISLYAIEGGIVAGRVSRLVRGTDLSLVFRNRDVGVSVSRVFGDALELHGELARTAHTRVVAGGQYTFSNNTNLVLELYHGTDGLTARQWDAFRDGIAGDLRGANARYAPLRMARTYGFTRVAKGFGKADAELIAITNLRDGSTLVRALVSYKLRPNVSLYVIDTEFLGASTAELAYLQIERVTTFGARYYF
ncbi:MAG: hypothetical protein M3Q69_02590 [Acidobacteriota bacterium]|nr:hypothetical protein [Acidobacteriota bacterium]